MRTTVGTILLALGLLAPSALSAQGSGAAKSPLIGTWRVVETQTGPVSQPSLFIFTARHYSRMNVAGGQGRTMFKDAANATPAEKVAAFDTFTANTGTYQIAGDSIVFDVVLAKVPNNVGRNAAKTTFKVEGTTLTLTNVDTKAFFKLTRLE